MIGDKYMFLTLRKERDGSVSFGNDDSAKIIGKDIAQNWKQEYQGRKCSASRRYET
jgi:hypothetical protein